MSPDVICTHPWHFMGRARCPGCKGTQAKKNLAGLIKGSPDWKAAGGVLDDSN